MGNKKGCCSTCNGNGGSYDIETNGQCWDCYGTGHTHEGECKQVSKYFVLAEEGIGPGGQVYFRNGHPEYRWYDVYLDKVKIGKVMDTGYGRRRWSGLSHAEESEFFKTRMLDGFATRWDAAVFIFKHNGYWMHTERDHARDMVRFEKRSNQIKMSKAYEIMKRAETI